MHKNTRNRIKKLFNIDLIFYQNGVEIDVLIFNLSEIK